MTIEQKMLSLSVIKTVNINWCDPKQKAFHVRNAADTGYESFHIQITTQAPCEHFLEGGKSRKSWVVLRDTGK